MLCRMENGLWSENSTQLKIQTIIMHNLRQEQPKNY